jgi:transposase
MRTDARRLSHDKLTEIRRRGVEAVQGGESPEVVARVLGVSRASVYGWLALFRSGGWGALDARKRGGRRPKLDAKAIGWIYRTVAGGDPRQFKFPFALWTSAILRTVLRRELGIELSRASICRLLNQLGLTAQRPLWRAYQQNPEVVNDFLQVEYPRLRKRAQAVGAEIWFADEAGVRSDAHAGTTWAPRGKTPVVSSTGARFGLNLMSAVTRQGHFRFTCVPGRVNGPVFVEFLRRLLHDSRRRVFLVVDRHPAHTAAVVKRFVASQGGRLEIHFLPPYSPELNPDEQVWNDLKNNALGPRPITGPDQLKHDVLSHLHHLQHCPGRIQSFFQTRETAYAA